MKKQIFKLIAFVTAVATLLGACKKNPAEPEPAATVRLTKVSSWNPSTGAETTVNEYSYNADGTLKNVTSARVNLNVTYANGKVASAKGVNSTGGEVSYAITYNASGQITKVVNVYMNPTDFGSTKNYEYNAAGKVSKITTNFANGGMPGVTLINEYFWNGDNIEGTKATSGTSSTQASYKYDDKLNPYHLGEGMAAILSGAPQSKNNATEITTVNSSGTVVQKRSYEYNAAGYATSMKLLDGSNEGQKYYYLP
ncbi:MAG: hypothetical protein REI78_14290 [Pedobacter sp.]|nr:hypothetical protein [Pedobacter sp.]MDQ8054197.1 hypothetical protein [Pedobacter sp.]